MMCMLTGRPKTISQAISLHLSARSTAMRLSQYSCTPWSIFLAPAIHLFRLREKQALRELIELEPQYPREAQEKLLHLLALLTANAAALILPDVQRAIETLRPFKSCLADTTCRSVSQRAEPVPRAHVRHRKYQSGGA